MLASPYDISAHLSQMLLCAGNNRRTDLTASLRNGTGEKMLAGNEEKHNDVSLLRIINNFFANASIFVCNYSFFHS